MDRQIRIFQILVKGVVQATTPPVRRFLLKQLFTVLADTGGTFHVDNT